MKKIILKILRRYYKYERSVINKKYSKLIQEIEDKAKAEEMKTI